MDGMRVLSAREGRRGSEVMRGVMGLARGGLGSGRRAVVTIAAEEQPRRYLRAMLAER